MQLLIDESGKPNLAHPLHITRPRTVSQAIQNLLDFLIRRNLRNGCRSDFNLLFRKSGAGKSCAEQQRNGGVEFTGHKDAFATVFLTVQTLLETH